MKTFMLRKEDVEHKWYVIDAEGKTLGKVAERAAYVLKGKHKPTFTPHVACGDNVIIINAEKVGLCFPLNTKAALSATLPKVFPSASITYHLCSTFSFFNINVFIINFPSLTFALITFATITISIPQKLCIH